ncbi:TetR/AcrR family transcriptional regulator [Microbacterium sp. WCS2018Hpa-23]|uniref:TetR/AcrR family transcriptional regulator n=1 Tax=Microbacterium sp. WCS2018Hpa-23 TaxID=3073634 RepID=UPI0028833848|nr:TetR/AcrR family transcriptional regulator [Microbacterium sp. WCS2018Hpa-23]
MSRHKEFSPDVVLEQAMLVFWEQGFAAASTSELSTRMGIGKRSMYDTFGDKRELYIASLRHYIGTTDSERDRAASQADSLQEALIAVLGDHPSKTPRPAGCFATTAAAIAPAGDDEIRSLVEDHIERGRKRIATQLLRFTAASAASAADIARLAQDTVMGLRVRARAGLTRPRRCRNLGRYGRRDGRPILTPPSSGATHISAVRRERRSRS